MKNLRLLLADSHNLIRQCLCALLEAIPEFTIVGEAADGVSAVNLIEQELPDIALVDLNLPNMNGLDVIVSITQRAIKTDIIILSIHDDTVYALRALKNGARGYLLKDSELEEIVHAIRQVGDGKLYLNPLFANQVLDAWLRPADPPKPIESGLTLRERQVLQMISEGATNTKIATKLVISKRTVETHRANLMRKLNVKSQVELVRVAITRGIVSTGLSTESFLQTEL